MKNDYVPNAIKVGAVVTAAPRWVAALLAAEGFVLPESWLVWWVPLSALLSLGMAVVEGLAFAYIFNKWKKVQDRKLLFLAVISAIVFVIVLAPFIASQVRGELLSATLDQAWMLWLWAASVAASTIVIVASVGYAQQHEEDVSSETVENFTATIRELKDKNKRYDDYCTQLNTTLQELQTKLEAYSRFNELADYVKASLFVLFLESDMTVNDIAKSLDVSVPTVYKGKRLLKEVGEIENE